MIFKKRKSKSNIQRLTLFPPMLRKKFDYNLWKTYPVVSTDGSLAEKSSTSSDIGEPLMWKVYQPAPPEPEWEIDKVKGLIIAGVDKHLKKIIFNNAMIIRVDIAERDNVSVDIALNENAYNRDVISDVKENITEDDDKVSNVITFFNDEGEDIITLTSVMEKGEGKDLSPVIAKVSYSGTGAPYSQFTLLSPLEREL